MHPDIRPAKTEDAFGLADRLRPEDKAEVWAACGKFPLAALLEGVYFSRPCYAMVPDGNLVGMFGVTPTAHDRNLGVVWMLAAPELEQYSLRFLRESRKQVDRLNDLYPVLYNYVDARNTVHIKWLKWCGFTFINYHERYGFEGRPFYEFVRIADV